MDWRLFIRLAALFGVIVLGLWLANLPREKRHRQLWCPVAALLLVVAVLGLAYRLRFTFAQLPPGPAGLARQTGAFVLGAPPQTRLRAALAFNLLLLAFFLVLKGGWAVLWRTGLWQRLTGSSGGAAEPRLAYHRDRERGLLLEAAWFFPRLVTRRAAWLTGGVLAGALVAATLFDPLDLLAAPLGLPSPGWPYLVALPLLVLLETHWYLNGPRPLAEGSETFDPVDSRREGSFQSLWEEYLQLWPDQVLIASDHAARPRATRQTARRVSSANGAPDRAMRTIELNTVWDQLAVRDDFDALDGSHKATLEALWSGEDVLLEDAVYESLAPVLFSTLRYDLLNGGHVLLLTEPEQLHAAGKGEQSNGDARRVIEWTENWLDRLYGEGMPYRVRRLRDFRQQQEKPHVLVASAGDLLDQHLLETHGAWFEQVSTVVVLDAARAVFRHTMPTGALLHALRDRRARRRAAASRETALARSGGAASSPLAEEASPSAPRALRCVLLSENRIALESSMSRNLPLRLREQRLPPASPEAAFAIVWRAEGEWFQHRFFSHVGGHIGDEPVLALPAWREGVDPIRLADQERLPVNEFIEELERHRSQLDEHPEMPNERLHGTAHERLQRDEPSWLLPPLNRSLLLARDRDHNCAAALRRWLPLARREAFVHVVSPPYLLRDYLADNTAFFLHVDAPVVTRAPRIVEHTAFAVAYDLLERLVAAPLTEDAVRRTLKGAVERTYPVEDALQEVFERAFGIDLLASSYLRVNTRPVFHEDEDRFRDVAHLRLSADIRDDAHLHWMRRFEVMDNDDHVLDTVSRDHLYQTYLPGQMHAFDGKAYVVQEIDEEHGVVRVDHRQQWEDALYRPDREARLGALAVREDAVQRRSGGWTACAEIGEARLSVQTPGYYHFVQALSLQEGEYVYREVDVPERTYRSARVMRLAFRPQADAAENGAAAVDAETARRIAFTLAVLFHEAFPSFFPETHELILTGTPAAPPRRDALAPLMPALHVGEPEVERAAEEDTAVALYFAEDAHADPGLVQCLFDEWRGCLDVLRDYLHWACGDEPIPPPDAADWIRRVDDRLAFLKYGREDVPDALDLDATLHFLDTALPRDPDELHARRRNFYTPSPVQRPADLTIGPACDFCGTPLSEVEHERLGDGRVRCDPCGETATDTEEELREAYEEARRFLETDLGLDVRQSVRVVLTDAQKVHEAAGQSFVPTTGYDARTIGVATRQGDDFAIHVENGQPYHRTLSTAVHELTHIWQYDHLDFAQMTEEHGKLLVEGHAVWADLEVLKRRDLRPDYVERETQRDDVYGEGYRRLRDMLDDAPEHDTPFALLADLYPPE